MGAESNRADELTAVIREIQQRVRSRHPQGALGVGNIPIPDLMPLVHARDAAEAKVAAIGTVNPRPGGLANTIVQAAKKLVARALDWHVREQVEFNRAVVSCVQSALDAFEEQNRAMSQLAGYFHGRISEMMGEVDRLRHEMAESMRTVDAEAEQMRDIRKHWAEWRAGWEEKLNRGEVYMLRTISELNASFQHRATLTENQFRETMREHHANYNVALEKAAADIQQRLWADLDRIRTEYEEIIQAELRIVRQRGAAQTVSGTVPVAATGDVPRIDWLRFADRFRGPEEYVRKGLSLYLEKFAGARDVLDLGCGRGEFLEAAREAGIPARGIDLNPETVALCRSKGLNAETADLFEYLSRQPDESLGGIYCSQVIEHLPPARLPDLVRLAAAKLERGAIVAFETPNPEQLEIFATHFFLDPTHTRPVPPVLMAFYLEEAGLGRIEINRLQLDYAVFAIKL